MPQQKKHSQKVTAATPMGPKTYSARVAVVTLPLGVLKAPATALTASAAAG